MLNALSLRFDYQGRVIRLDTFSKVPSCFFDMIRDAPHIILDNCSWMSSGMDDVQPCLRREDYEGDRDFDAAALWIWPGRFSLSRTYTSL